MIFKRNDKTLDSLEQLRAKIEPLTAERADLLAWPMTREEVRLAVRNELTAKRDVAKEYLTSRLRQVALGRKPTHLISLNETGTYQFEGGDAHKLFAALLIGAAGTKALEAMCDEVVAALPIVTDRSTRERRLAELNKELDAMERAEEEVISEAEARGVYIPRRRDVRPEIVLAVD